MVADQTNKLLSLPTSAPTRVPAQSSEMMDCEPDVLASCFWLWCLVTARESKPRKGLGEAQAWRDDWGGRKHPFVGK